LRREFETSEARLECLLSPRDWADLGRRMGFVARTVEPIEGKGERHFSAEAVPCEE